MRFSDPKHNIAHLKIEHGMRIAEFGCGAGHYSLSLAPLAGENGRVYAIDIQQNLLSKVKNTAREEHLDNIDVIVGDLESLHGSTLADNLVDAVIMANVLFQIEDREAFIGEAMRVLKPRGKLLVVDWKDSYEGLGPAQEHVLQQSKAEALCKAAGFKLVEVFNAGAHHYGLLYEKT
jgi:ubiquinone/menaquinone biosynthesis C-methylase UbiE